MKIEKKTLLELYATMLTIRHFEDRVVDLYARGLVRDSPIFTLVRRPSLLAFALACVRRTT